MTGPTECVLVSQGIIQLGIVFMQMAPIAFSLAGEALHQKLSLICIRSIPGD